MVQLGGSLHKSVINFPKNLFLSEVKKVESKVRENAAI